MELKTKTNSFVKMAFPRLINYILHHMHKGVDLKLYNTWCDQTRYPKNKKLASKMIFIKFSTFIPRKQRLTYISEIIVRSEKALGCTIITSFEVKFLKKIMAFNIRYIMAFKIMAFNII